MLLGKNDRRDTTRLEAAPDSGQPAHHRHPAQAGRVVQHSAAAAMSDREHPAQKPTQANQTRPSARAAANHRLELRSRACLERRTSHWPGRTSAPSGHTYSGSPSGRSSDCLVASDPEGPAPSPHDQHAQSAGCSTMLNLRRPGNRGHLGSGVRPRSVREVVVDQVCAVVRRPRVMPYRIFILLNARSYVISRPSRAPSGCRGRASRHPYESSCRAT